jgi:hypothetical protein
MSATRRIGQKLFSSQTNDFESFEKRTQKKASKESKKFT